MHCCGPEGGGNFSHVEYEADCSLMITSTEMKAEDLLPKELVLFLHVVCPEQRVRGLFPHTVRFFPLRWCGPTTSK